MDFYDNDTLTDAKSQLLYDSKDLCRRLNMECLPVPENRTGERRTEQIMDDIFQLLKFLDAKCLMNELPVYVSDNPDRLPSLRLYECDFSVIALLGKIESKMAAHDSMLAAIGANLQSLQVNSQVCYQGLQQTNRMPNVGQISQPVVGRPPHHRGRSVFLSCLAGQVHSCRRL